MKKLSMGRKATSGRFLLNRAYVKCQAKEAVNVFFAPVAGIYNGVTGERMHVGRVDRIARPSRKRA